jgi:hypothetical protein
MIKVEIEAKDAKDLMGQLKVMCGWTGWDGTYKTAEEVVLLTSKQVDEEAQYSADKIKEERAKTTAKPKVKAEAKVEEKPQAKPKAKVAAGKAEKTMLDKITEQIMAKGRNHGEQIKTWVAEYGVRGASEVPEECQEEFLGKLKAL